MTDLLVDAGLHDDCACPDGCADLCSEADTDHLRTAKGILVGLALGLAL